MVFQQKYSAQDRTKKEVAFGKWQVHLNGDMIYDNGRYEISSDRLDESDWVAHLFGKGWIDWNDFIPAYFQACKNAEIQEVSLLIYY